MVSLMGKSRLKRDIVTNAPSVIENHTSQTYENIVQALKNNVNNQTLSSLSVGGLSEEELNDKEYAFQLFVNYCIKNHNLDAVKLLVAKGIGVNVRGGDNNTTILHHAAKEGNWECSTNCVKNSTEFSIC
ncbi:ankyrin repeat domain-containing protein [Candidatus Mesenet endosymbiont of Agriotes lineatus]|uniref:ankyrin repeat domain-containing protein n=1 Tax=Candidatus Mesenet endosymbiont of Agriotes lineatus TaxID=3077948 RepID=UPI0030CC1415